MDARSAREGESFFEKCKIGQFEFDPLPEEVELDYSQISYAKPTLTALIRGFFLSTTAVEVPEAMM